MNAESSLLPRPPSAMAVNERQREGMMSKSPEVIRLFRQRFCSVGLRASGFRRFCAAAAAAAAAAGVDRASTSLPQVKLSALGCAGGNGASDKQAMAVGGIIKKALASQEAATGTSGLSESSDQQKAAKEAFDYFVVVDFEATCDETVFFPQEIIEFPSVLIAVNSLSVEDSFQTYVKPIFNPLLTDFCKRLTGIQQAQVDNGVALADALDKHDKWLEEKGVKDKNFGVITWTDWDCKVMLEFECKLKGLKKPPYFNRWINLKSLFQSQFGDKFNLKRAVLHAGLQWEGREHCGLDDAKNTASLAMELMKRGIHIGYTDPNATIKKPAAPNNASEFLPKLKKILEALPRSGDVEDTDSATDSASLCYCGVKCKTRLVRKAGPNHGKLFLSCGNWSLTEGGKCTYFEWTTATTAATSSSETPEANS